MTHRRSLLIALSAASFLLPATTTHAADEPAAAGSVKQTFVVQGLHCPPCTNTVAAALKRTKRVENVKVDWNTKNAWITFDERLISAQQVAQQIAATPHMMGRGMHYQASLALKVSGVKDDAAAEKAKAALADVPGVAAVYAYPQHESVAVRFGEEGKATTADLIAALKKAGFDAAPF